MKPRYILFFALSLIFGSWGPALSQDVVNDFPEAFQNLPAQAENREFNNSIQFDAKGCHLQGIQLYKENDQLFAYISGSSATKSYMATVSLESPARVVAIDELMPDPFRHAGGFQIFENFLAVGIEDNYKRTSSVVRIYNLPKTQNDWSQPLYTIHRAGDFERFTAGAVGITKYKEEILLAVANWNSLNIDFYTCPTADFYGGVGEFHHFAVLTPADVSPIGWSDSVWRSYQNINLFADAKEGLYLLGFAREGKDQHLAEVFELTYSDSMTNSGADLNLKGKIQIQKIISKSFKAKGQTDFRAGAGLSILGGELILVSSPNQIEPKTSINFFQGSLSPTEFKPQR